MRLIPLTQGQFAKVDDTDYDRLSAYLWSAQWCVKTKSFYARRWVPKKERVDGKKILSMHRAIMRATPEQLIDHINHDTLDNQRCNLRCATSSENSHNRKGVAGFHFRTDARTSRYRVRIGVAGKRISVGTYRTEEEAKTARIKAEQRYFGEFAPQRELDIE